MDFLHSAAITCKFAHENEDYVAYLSQQNYGSSDRDLRIYGRHEYGKKNIDVKKLDASHKDNKLSLIPTTIFKIFSNLIEVRLKDCGLKKLTADSFKYCRSMQTIRLGKDDITYEADVFKQCRRLETLEFDESDLSNMNPNALGGLENLKVLIMNKCNLKEINPQLMSSLVNLEELHITGNPDLTEIPKNIIGKFLNLKVLNVSGNSISDLSNYFVEEKNDLEVADFSFNNISKIQRNLLEVWPNNAALNLSNNDCINKEFGHLGTNDFPMFEVVEYLMKCFPNDESSNDETSTGESSTDKTSTNKTHSSESGSSESLNGSETKNTTTNSELVKNLKAAQDKLMETNDDDDEDIAQKVTDKIPDEIPEQVEGAKKENDNGEILESPYEFIKGTMKIKNGKSSIQAQINNGTATATNSTEVSGSDEDISPFFTETISSTTTETTTQEEVQTTRIPKRKRKKQKKVKVTEPSEVISESPTADTETTVAVEKSDMDTTFYVGEIENATEVSQTNATTPYLHDYEQASCRFYIDANKEYNCVLEGVTPELKRINVDHLGNLTNESVTKVFLRDSVLINVPRILTDIFPNLNHLSIGNTNIKTLDNEFIEDCKNIKDIDLRGNKIHHVKKDCFKKCLNLEAVNLSDNPIEMIQSEIFQTNPKLTIIINKIKITPSSDE